MAYTGKAYTLGVDGSGDNKREREMQ